MSPKKPAPVTDRRSQQALDLFERAAKALGKHDWEKARDLLDGLLSKGFLTSTISPADLPLVGGAGQAVVVVAGGNSAPAVPIESFLLPFVADLELYPGVPVAAAESTTTATFPFVSLLRDDGQLKSDPMVTVDDVDPDHAGGIALVLGLKNLLSLGTGGNYGLKDGNDGLLPKAA